MHPRRLDPSEFLQPRAGYHYEPRVLWGRKILERVVPQESSAVLLETDFGVGDFYNAEPYPIVITKMLVMSQPMDRVVPPRAGSGSQDQHAQNVSIRVSRRGIRPLSFEMTPNKVGWLGCTNLGPESLIYNPEGFGTSSYFGTDTAMWDFDFPIRVLDKGAIQFDIAPLPPIVDGLPDDEYALLNVKSTAVFTEAADAPQRTPGSMRANSMLQRPMSLGMFEKVRTPLGAQSFVSGTNTEFGPDPFAVTTPAASTWNNGYGMNPVTFSRQQSSPDRASLIQGLTVSFARIGSGGELSFGDTSSNHLAYAAVSRARTRSGGTGAWWWREGAPLAITMPSITPASVFEFKRPFILDLSDELEVQADIPLDALYPGYGQVSYLGTPSTYASHGLYVSFAGYACIKD